MNICAYVKPLTCSLAHDASACGACYRDERVSRVRSRDRGSPSGVARQRRSARGEVYPWSCCSAAHEPRWFSSPMACHQGREAEALHSPLAPRFPPALVTRKEPVSSLLCAEWPVSVTECSSAPENAPNPHTSRQRCCTKGT